MKKPLKKKEGKRKCLHRWLIWRDTKSTVPEDDRETLYKCTKCKDILEIVYE